MHHSEDISSETFEYPLIAIEALDMRHPVFQLFFHGLVQDSIAKYDCCHGDHTENKVTIHERFGLRKEQLLVVAKLVIALEG